MDLSITIVKTNLVEATRFSLKDIKNWSGFKSYTLKRMICVP